MRFRTALPITAGLAGPAFGHGRLSLVGAVTLLIALMGLQPPALAAVTPAESLTARVQQSVVTVTIKLEGQGEAQSVGSGFFADAQGRVVTNYHVVAKIVRKPKGHRLEVELPGGVKVPAQVVAFDVVDDLALLKLDPAPAAARATALRVASGLPSKGSPLFAFGNASAMGVVETRGHFSGLVSKLGFDRMQFTGTLIPGMSGGPAVNGRGELVGVNVSRRADAEQQGFLVPVSRVRALLLKANSTELARLSASDQIRDQLITFQAQVRKQAIPEPPVLTDYGPYMAAEFGGDRLQCRPLGKGNTDVEETEVVFVLGRKCFLQRSIDLGEGLTAGELAYSHIHMRSLKLNDFRFNAFVDGQSVNRLSSALDDDMAQGRCTDSLTLAGPRRSLPVRIQWCAQAYREFEGLYDVYIRMVTRDRPNEALVSSMLLAGVSWETAGAYTRHLVETLQ